MKSNRTTEEIASLLEDGTYGYINCGFDVGKGAATRLRELEASNQTERECRLRNEAELLRADKRIGELEAENARIREEADKVDIAMRTVFLHAIGGCSCRVADDCHKVIRDAIRGCSTR